MKRISILLFVILFFSSPTAASDIYFSINGGASVFKEMEVTASGNSADVEFADYGWALAGAIGNRFAENWRIEVELAYQESALDTISNEVADVSVSGDISMMTIFGNIYFDFIPNGATPFIFAGAGAAIVDLGNVTYDELNLTFSGDNDTVVGYNLGGGISIPTTEKATIDIKYKYTIAPNININDAESDLTTHCILIGGHLYF